MKYVNIILDTVSLVWLVFIKGKYYPQDGPYYPADGYTGGQPYARETVYIEEPAPRNNWWLTSLLALCCGCLVGEACCDEPCLCCVFPCPTIRFNLKIM
ncbi:hypothetical protein OESDEN_24276 [Oesophagostomum dentatum]|uniref:Cysteine-rich transmembrane CYSTM domain-containing protein n=1 Tax=Oesophagostomum dentatum TaxID=61180 RepID=A0A0B1RYK6_OESDE|nr:hypothetical protein OESDEN_24276 [Oesophagostomum dentatum]